MSRNRKIGKGIVCKEDVLMGLVLLIIIGAICFVFAHNLDIPVQ